MGKSEGIGGRIAPPRFLAFLLIAVAGIAGGTALLGWRHGVMVGFDVAAVVFLLSCVPLFDDETHEVRAAARANDANRAVLLAITIGVSFVVLAAVASELSAKQAPRPAVVALIVGTLALAWTFSNMVYAFHYAHLFYLDGEGEKDRGGLDVPKTEEPDYWDFLYFSFCLGMTFQTSDVEMTDGRFRRTATFHCLAAFVFNLGVLAFTINVLGGG